MPTQFEETLLSVLPDTWEVRQVIVLDWQDGPREGICELARPHCAFHFAFFAERRSEDNLDDRLFRISEAQVDIVERALRILAQLGPPRNPVWVPIWRFDSETAQVEAEDQLEALLADLKRTNLIIRTADMVHFLGCWKSIS